MLRFLWRAYRARFRDQRTEIRELRTSIQPGEIAVDVGAHKGSYLYWLSRAASPGKVFAFEPQPMLAEYLRTKCAAAGLKNVVVEAVGVSDHCAQMTLHVPSETVSQGASFENAILEQANCHSYSVPVVTLDEYFQSRTQRIAAIKIDAEGHEFAVLRGAQNILTQDAPCLTIECEARHLKQRSVSDVLSYLQSLGFQGSFVHRGQLRPIAEFDLQTHQKVTSGQYWGEKDYCNNFVLRKRAA